MPEIICSRYADPVSLPIQVAINENEMVTGLIKSREPIWWVNDALKFEMPYKQGRFKFEVTVTLITIRKKCTTEVKGQCTLWIPQVGHLAEPPMQLPVPYRHGFEAQQALRPLFEAVQNRSYNHGKNHTRNC